jgi:hypothetical protein
MPLPPSSHTVERLVYMVDGIRPTGERTIIGQTVRFPLLVKIRFDEDFVGSRTGDENFIKQAAAWKPDPKAAGRARAAEIAARLEAKPRRRRGA